MPDLVETLNKETGWPWEWHRRRNAAVLFFGRPIPDGPRTVSSHAVIVFGDSEEMGAWHADVLRRNVDGTSRALRVPGNMSWMQLLDFVTMLVEKLGGVSPLYQPVQR
jgi:hypothetical protein